MSESEGKRRFCDSCAKDVHDVSAMTEREAWMVLADESKKGRVCVRYTLDGRTGRIKYQVQTVSAPPPTFSSLVAAATVSIALLGTGCTNSEPSRMDDERCHYDVGPFSFTTERGEGTCPDSEPEIMGDVAVDNGEPIEPVVPDTAIAGAIGVEPIEPMVMGEAPALIDPPEPVVERMGKIAAPPTEHVKMGDIGPIDEPCDDPSEVGTTTTPTAPSDANDRPRRL